MTCKLTKKNQILLFILFFFIFITIITSLLKEDSDKINPVKPKVQEANNTLKPESNTTTKEIFDTGDKIKQTLPDATTEIDITKIPPFSNEIDFIGKKDSLIDLEPILEIDQIMEQQKKIDTFVQERNLIKNQEDWEVDYEIGFEDAAIENLKTDPSLKPEVVNVKVGFSKSF